MTTEVLVETSLLEAKSEQKDALRWGPGGEGGPSKEAGAGEES